MRIQAEARREAQTRAQLSHKQHRTNSWHFLFGCSCSCSGDEHPNFPSSSAEREYYSKSLCIGIWLTFLPRMSRILRVLVLLLLSSGLVCAQSTGRDGPSLEQSVTIYEGLVEVAAQQNDPTLLAKRYYKLGGAYYGLNKIDRAID